MEFIALYWVEFLTIASVHLLAVASPGPDFAVVLKHSISFGRRAGILTAIGVGIGILVHVAYSLLGIGILIQTTPWLFDLFRYAAAGYLIYIGISALRSQPSEQQDIAVDTASLISDKKAFWVGFLTNGLNPKATLFFLSLFAVIVSTQTPNGVKAFYGVYLAIATGAWFCFLAYVLSSAKVRGFIGKNGHWFDRLMGAVLIGLAVKLLSSGLPGQ
ncbi:MAG: LysE family translocator [Alteromonadaceae bacterium]|nr:LysE family translocator [Alteromonadaceae bacterium]